MLFYVIISVSTVKEVQDMKKRIAIFSAVLEVLTVFGTACGGRTAAPGVTFGQPTDTKPGTLPPTEQPTSGGAAFLPRQRGGEYGQGQSEH